MSALLIFSVTISQAESRGPGTTGPDFLLDITDARVLALGGSLVAFAQNGAAVEINPAVLADLGHFEAGFIHKISWVGFNTQRLNFFHPGGRIGAFGISFSRRSAPRIDNPTDTPDLDPPVVSWDSRLSLNWAKVATSRMAIGAKADLGLSRLGSFYGVWGFLGMGILHRLAEGWTAGLSLRRLGLGPRFAGVRSPLPLSLEAGVNRRLILGRAHRLDLLVSSLWQRGPGLGASLGFEWQRTKGISLRAGYRFGQEESFLSGPGFGFSYAWEAKALGLILDYAWKPIQPGLGSIHSDHWVGFRLSWGGVSREDPTSVEDRAVDLDVSTPSSSGQKDLAVEQKPRGSAVEAVPAKDLRTVPDPEPAPAENAVPAQEAVRLQDVTPSEDPLDETRENQE